MKNLSFVADNPNIAGFAIWISRTCCFRTWENFHLQGRGIDDPKLMIYIYIDIYNKAYWCLVGKDGNGGMGWLLLVTMDHSLIPC